MLNLHFTRATHVSELLGVEAHDEFSAPGASGHQVTEGDLDFGIRGNSPVNRKIQQ